MADETPAAEPVAEETPVVTPESPETPAAEGTVDAPADSAPVVDAQPSPAPAGAKMFRYVVPGDGVERVVSADSIEEAIRQINGAFGTEHTDQKLQIKLVE